MVAKPTYPMAPNGSSDFNSPLKPVREKIWPSFWAGLSRSILGTKASGANTRPPWASPPTKDKVHAVAITGTTHLASVHPVHTNNDALGDNASPLENSIVC